MTRRGEGITSLEGSEGDRNRLANFQDSKRVIQSVGEIWGLTKKVSVATVERRSPSSERRSNPDVKVSPQKICTEQGRGQSGYSIWIL